jgi:hypothetical protein
MRMKYCSIEWTQDGAATTFDGDIRCPSTPHDTHHYHVIAHRCGCGDDVRQYCRDHELAHVILSEWFQQCAPASLLETSVHGNALDWGTNMMEECTAHVLQRWVRCNERPIIGRCDWDAMKAQFLECAAALDREFNERIQHADRPCAPDERQDASTVPTAEERFFHLHD